MIHRTLSVLLFISVGIITPATLAAQVNFSGELKPEVILNIPGSSGYGDTPLNPDNQMDINDVMFRNEINLKLDAMGESSALDLWFQVKLYPIADLFIGSAAIAEAASAAGSNELSGYTAGVGDMFFVVDPYIFSLGIMRASASWMPSDATRITLGRQSFLTGYGYGWNPVDLANPPKDPTDPQNYLRGVDALNVQISPAAWLNTRFYAALPSDDFAWDYDEILVGGEITFYVPMMEFKIAGLYGGAESDSDIYNHYPDAGVAAFYVDVLGIGIYGEGWNSSERSDYSTALEALDSSGGITGEYYSLYTPTYFARHYILTNLLIPWYAIDSSINLNIIWSPDSGAVIFTPNASFNLNYEGTLTSEIWYSGMISYDDDEMNEVWLAPVNNSFWFNLRYYF